MLPIGTTRLSDGAVRARLAGVVLLALALRGLWVLVVWPMPMVSDAASYLKEAEALLRHFPPEDPLYWPPGNSLMLAIAFKLFGPSLATARLVLLVLATSAVVFSMLIATWLHPDNRTVIATGALAAAYLPSVLLAGQTYSQHLAGLCFVVLAYSILRARPSASLVFCGLSGLALGLGCLTRPSMLSLLPVTLAALFWPTSNVRATPPLSQRFRGVVFSAACAATCLTPALMHNRGLGAGLVLSINNERNFFLGNNPYTPDYKTSHLGQRPLAELEPEVRVYLQSVYRRPDARAAMVEEAWRYVLTHPGRTLLRTWNRALAFWGFDYLASRAIQSHYRNGRVGLALLVLEAGSYVLTMSLVFLALCYRWGTMDRGTAVILLALVFAYEAPYTIAFSGGTYHFPVMGLLQPFAGIGLSSLPRPSCGAQAASVSCRRCFWVALSAFVLLQIQYAWYAVRFS